METIPSLKNKIIALKQQIKGLKRSEKVASTQVKMQAAVQLQQARFRTVFESSRLGNKIISPDLKILEVNQALVTLLGYSSKKDLIGTKILDYSPVEHHQHWKMLQENLWKETSPSFTLETCLRKKDGSLIWCTVNSILFKDEGQTLGFTTIENITVKRDVRLHKDEFINIASHELKTPITSLKAVVQLMNRMLKKDSLVIDKVKELASGTERYIDKLINLVEDLLNSTRVGASELNLTKTVFSIKEVIENCCPHVRVSAKHQINHTGNLNVMVCADMHRIDQVLINFVNNAVKYSPNSFDIDIAVTEQEGMVKVSVTDYGQGISAEYLPYLFDRYYSVSKNASQGGGMGLGLYISAEIIRKHGGDIGVNSELGKGSTFWFIIPTLQ
jgi:PAS domain S-box-containing protein